MTIPECIDAFSDHVCGAVCAVQYVLFSRLKTCRPDTRLLRHGQTTFRVDPGALQDAPPPSFEVSTFRVTLDDEPLVIPTFDYHEPYPAFPEVRDDGFKLDIIRDYQQRMDLSNFEWVACAVCGQRKFSADIQSIHPEDIDLTLLRNDTIPSMAWPTSYDFELYDRAILEPVALGDPWSLQDMSVCSKCASCLERGGQPLEALANHQYYGLDSLPADVAEAFRTSTAMERQLVSACRATTISCTYKADKGGVPGARQRYCRGNVAIIPQDICSLRRVLPPSLEEARDLMCVLFVGRESVPTMQTVKKMSPCLVSRRRVELMIRFLVEHNQHYRRLGVTYSAANLAAICSGPGFGEGDDVGVPASLDVQHLPVGDVSAEAVTSRYDSSGNAPFIIPPDAIFTETTGFANTSQGAITDSQMKARALRWCLDGQSFFDRPCGGSSFS